MEPETADDVVEVEDPVGADVSDDSVCSGAEEPGDGPEDRPAERAEDPGARGSKVKPPPEVAEVVDWSGLT